MVATSRWPKPYEGRVAHASNIAPLLLVSWLEAVISLKCGWVSSSGSLSSLVALSIIAEYCPLWLVSHVCVGILFMSMSMLMEILLLQVFAARSFSYETIILMTEA